MSGVRNQFRTPLSTAGDCAGSGGRSRRHRIDRDLLSVLVLELELHHAVHQREKRVIVGAAHVPSRVEPGAALAHDDASGAYDLAAVALHAEILRGAVPAVPTRADTLLVSHPILSRA